MAYLWAVVISLVINCSGCVNLTFPPEFKFGAATAAYQVEGAWNESDRSECIWDRLLHKHPEIIGDGTNGDVACDSYHLWRRDIEMAEELGLDFYRFSISWTRILPNGFANYINEDGKKYYSNIIDGLLERGIEPVVTMYHFDLPQSLQDLGGWANPLIPDWFADYARVLYSLYADRVKTWLTLNEPIAICDSAYNKMAAPYIDDSKIGAYLCNKYTLMAHAKAWRIYDEEYRSKYHGKVSLSNVFTWFEPLTAEDIQLAQLSREYWEGRFGHAIYSEKGGWPPTLEKVLAESSKREGYPAPRLPPFTVEEIEFVRGTYDFYGLNHYLSRLVRRARPGEVIGAWPLYGCTELGMIMENDPSWELASADWFAINPKGIRRELHWLKETYGIKEIMITENGYPSVSARMDDWDRVKYIRDYLEQILLAIEDGINVTGYTVWSMMDNFEWLGGYSTKFGIYSVNFSDPMRKRTPRESARYYARMTRSRTTQPKEYVPLYFV